MTDHERVKLLETALIKYVELYGFIDEARDYYIRSARLSINPDKRNN
jgi:hypothetical protein